MKHIDGLVQERRFSIANAPDLRLFCTSLSMCLIGNEISKLTEELDYHMLYSLIEAEWRIYASVI